jgi:hypothetical protein
MSRVTLSDRDLRLLILALVGYVEGLDGDYDDDHVAMDELQERLRAVRRRRARRNPAADR